MTLHLPFPAARRVQLPKGGWLNLHEQPGKGPTLVLLHGFTDRGESFRLIAPHFAGFHLVMPDLRGHGESFRSDVTQLSDFASDLEDLCKALELKEVVLIGHSMGALVSLILAERGRLTLSGLVLLSGSLCPASATLNQITESFARLPFPLSAADSFLDDWYACSRPVARAFLDRLRASCVRMRPKDWMSCLALLTKADLRASAQAISAPSLIISGGQDTLFPSRHRAMLQDYLHPKAELFLPDVGHNPHWEAPSEVAIAILSFLGTLDPLA